MYQQGHPEGMGSGHAPQGDTSQNTRRRSRSRIPTEQPAPGAALQSGYGYAANGYQQPADAAGAYGGYNGYPAANAFPPAAQQQNGYYQQEQAGYYQNGYQTGYADPQARYYTQQQSDPQAGYYAQQQSDPQAGYYAQQANDQAYYQQAYQEQPSYGIGYQPPQQPQPRKSSGGKGSKGSKAGKANKTGFSLKDLTLSHLPPNIRNHVILAITLAAIAGVFFLVAGANNSRSFPANPPTVTQQTGTQTSTPATHDHAGYYATRFLPNVYVDGICLADMTFQEGSDAVWAHVRQKQNSWYVRLKNENGSYKDITAETLGISFDPTYALQQAWAVGHTPDANGQVTDRALLEAVNIALTTEHRFTSAQQSANTTPIDTILNTLQTNAYRAPQDAVILSFNPDDFVNPFTFQQEVWGQWLDVDAVKGQILQMVSTLESGEILLQITPIAPNVTVADLQKTVTLRCRAVTPISSSSTEDRTNNIRVAFAKINGKSIAHGDKFSFNKFVGRRSMENGFFQAIEYAYGEEVMGVGGGVCQASTTVYLAAIQSGMTITNREAHSNPVNYTSLGMDATVSDTRGREVDFTFRNESGGRIFIAAHVVESGSNRRSLLCEVRIYGPALEDVHYKLESETVEVIPKPEEPKYKEDESGDHAFYVDEQKINTKGREGYVVDTYLCTYQGDTLISRDKVSTDTYPARQDVYWVGVHTR